MQNTISFSTKFGWITATEQKNKVTSIHFKKSSKQGKTSFLLNKLKSDTNLFFKGETKLINLPLKIEGNSIQKKIWNELKKIPKGKTKSYGNIAKKLKISPRYVISRPFGNIFSGFWTILRYLSSEDVGWAA